MRKIVLFILLICATTISAQMNYRTELLRQIASFTNHEEAMDSLVDGTYFNTYYYKNHPLVVRVNNNCVEHIGLQMFSEMQRISLDESLLDFVERYFLSNTINIVSPWDVKSRLEIDDFHFLKGDMTFYKNLPNDSIYSFYLEQSERRICLEWKKGRTSACKIDFPNDFELILGTNRTTLQNNLLDNISKHNFQEHSLNSIPVDRLQYDSLENYYVLNGDAYYTSGINGNRYYQLNSDSVCTPYTDSLHIVETLSNLFSIPTYKNNYTFKIRHQKYGFKTEEFAIPVSKWVNYCLDEGCTPLFGITKIADYPMIECIVIMRNKEREYNHILRMKFDYSTLGKMEGDINATLTSFMNTSTIKYLYKEYKL